MKKKMIVLAAFLILILPLFSCIVTSVLIEVSVSCEDFSESPHSIINDFEIEVGDKVTVKLCSNASTGFSWDYVMSDDSVVKEEDYDFEEPASDLAGAAGTEVWTFEGIAAGTTVIDMEYSRSWEEDTEPAWTYKMTIKVE